MSNAVERAQILYSQGRHEAALDHINQELTSEPESFELHLLAAECQLALKRTSDARDSAVTAKGLAPGEAWPDLVLSRAALMDNRLGVASTHAREARAADPDDPTPYYLLAACELQKDRHRGALREAEQGLTIDPDHEGCLMIRSQALMALGRHEEAASDIERNLQLDPEDADNHTTAGLHALHRGQAAAAKSAFLEALRLDPDNEGARQGLVESLKTTNVFYRHFFRLLLWVQNLPTNVAFILLIGSVFLRGAARQAAQDHPQLLIPANLLVWGIFSLFLALMIAAPLSNLALFLHPLGRHALTRAEKIQALSLGGGAVIALAGLSTVFNGWVSGGTLALVCLMAMVPLAFATMPKLVPWSRALLLSLTLATYGGIGILAVNEFRREVFLDEHADVLVAMESDRTIDLRVDDPETAELVSEAKRMSEDAARLKPALATNDTLFPVLLWALIAFTWLGGFLIKTRHP